MDKKVYLNYWAERYKEDIINDIMPFWLKYGLDKEHGGIFTCVDRNGNLRAAWKAFPKGTNKNDVYGWFNRHHSKGLTYLMEEVKKE